MGEDCTVPRESRRRRMRPTCCFLPLVRDSVNTHLRRVEAYSNPDCFIVYISPLFGSPNLSLLAIDDICNKVNTLQYK